MTPEQRSLRSSIAGSTRHALHGSTELSRQGVEGALRRFEFDVDPTHALPDAERRNRALAARRAHMSRLALKSSKARKKAG